jgi:diacylglycerol kinase family enzyme
VNPISGGGRGRGGGIALAGYLRARGCHVEIFETDGPDAAKRRLAAPGAAAGIERIVCVGGDGTLNDVLNALPEPGAIPLGQLGYGTANMLTREFRIPRDPDTLAALVVAGSTRRLDLGTANGRRFFGNASAGFDARVVHHIAARRRGALGFWGYVAPGFASLRGYRPPRLALHLEDGAAGETLRGGMVICSNLRNYGGLFTLSRSAAPDSGLLEFCVFERAGIPRLLKALSLGALGRLEGAKGFAFRRARAARIESDGEPVPVQIDGDARGTTALTLSLEPGALRILSP